jgi:hypothetical protein
MVRVFYQKQNYSIKRNGLKENRTHIRENLQVQITSATTNMLPPINIRSDFEEFFLALLRAV